ncbi:IucA/IucC family siderophore biosynthesis protein [Fictibacillus nanhaiensis]|uniref:IucA/IucC family protein n=1 Tax=Fictibacillus nanhaiensis TaxID=742169 RepID=UPI001C9617A8|nr:IucA/IucC family protein [Fictibacillus nanhaiensis]MBY6037756.1 IucA/IucC family siderophore biosynthesis protein [Fictibacillus nanhaiensis]
MTKHKLRAEQASMQSFLNCYLRETQDFIEIENEEIEWSGETPQKWIKLSLTSQGGAIYAAVKHHSLTGRHLFHFPIFYKTSQHQISLDYVTLISLLSKELLLEQNREDAEDELMLRTILSCQNIKRYLEERESDEDKLNNSEFTFIEAEQSLLFGHLLHPTPKSKQGMTNEQESLYSPEMKGEFQLHFFKADRSIVDQDSADSLTAEEISLHLLQMDKIFLQTIKQDDSSVYIPVHPLQVPVLLEDEYVKKLIKKEKLSYIGSYGEPFMATSSMRSVYSKDFKYMFKFSVPVKITNSLRVNLEKELHRGVEVSRLMQSQIGQELNEFFPSFQVIKDPAFLNIATDKETSGFEVVIRENPFYQNDKNASLVAGLCQDHGYGGRSRISELIHEIAEKESRSTEAVSKDWFGEYLSIALDPMVWLYETYGIALEAHQQNSIVQLKGGYPSTFFYRDNQGYYYSESKADLLVKQLSDLNRKSVTICSDAVAIERFRYYFFMNHLFGLINGFGAAGLIEEAELMKMLRNRLVHHDSLTGGKSGLLRSLLDSTELPCKANLLTRFHDMDELVGSLETQSVYRNIPNPLQKVMTLDEARI